MKIIRSYTCMLLTNYTGYKVYGTGVFIQIEDNFLLVSASHVLDNFENLFIPIEEGKNLFKPGGISFINETSNSRNEDSVDIGFLKLDEESVKEILTTYKFLQDDDLAINHKFENQPFYTFLGFPQTFSKFSHSRNSFHSYPFFQFSTPIMESKYLKYDKSPNLNIITSYERKKSYNLKIKQFSVGPDLHGLSGCGLWFTNPMDILTQTEKPKLTAIMTDWPIKDRTKVIDTRIDVLTEVLRKKLNLKLPESNIISVK
ncbi:hypothetical protein [Aequorivita lipolytica]|uniref:Trypsin-like peptidase domain-containing protein n=1 Tax=Aequorivita lipolytica TaxID=153267 RepID=A0A5C6YMD6_9FLAO|nr:hypothetical protein [Aequorivita lipolytica]TXD68737.1 hypothetical protein ESV24_11280 [Aequorivita lipolytica]